MSRFGDAGRGRPAGEVDAPPAITTAELSFAADGVRHYPLAEPTRLPENSGRRAIVRSPRAQLLSMPGAEMRIRYIIRDGVRWEIVDAGLAEVADDASHQRHDERLLYFMSRFEMRRSDAAPGDWYLLDDESLDRLCALATPVAARPPYAHAARSADAADAR